MGCNITGGWPSFLIGVIYDSVSKTPIVGASISSPCWGNTKYPSYEDGEFVFGTVSQGLYDFVVEKEGYTSKTFTDLELLPNATKFLEVSLESLPTSVSGTVSIASPGNPNAVVSGVSVKLKRENIAISEQTSNNGTFNFDGLRTGLYEVIATYKVSGLHYKGAVGFSIEAGQSKQIAINMRKI